MVWGDLESTEKRQCSEAEKAASGWEAILQERKRARSCEPGAFWGSLDEPSSACSDTAIDFHLTDGLLKVQGGRHLASRLPLLPTMLDDTRSLDLRRHAVSRSALQAVVQFALAGPGAKASSPQWWTPCGRRPMSKASFPEAEQVEEALHCLEVLRAARILGVPRLQEEAEERLLGPSTGRKASLIGEATAMPLLASSFGREKAISQRCMQTLLERKNFWQGRERQLGVIYATQPVVGCLISGLFKAVARPLQCSERIEMTEVLKDLLFGPAKNLPESSPDFMGLLQAH